MSETSNINVDVFNVKPGQIRVVYDTYTKYQGTSLNENLLRGLDLLNILISVLTRFWQGKYAVMANHRHIFRKI